jgi:cyclic pyranopterin phosphate synthase
MKDKEFTHIDKAGNPRMVDVSDKDITKRIARAQAIIKPGQEILQHIQDNDIITKKGPVFQTAIIAGVSGAKKTSELIPFCHSIGLEDCRITIDIVDKRILVQTSATTTGKTGVEMEALTAASIAALTIYDMCKALSHNIIIEEIKLMEKIGGKSDFKRIE